jgi:hypothetical protein
MGLIVLRLLRRDLMSSMLLHEDSITIFEKLFNRPEEFFGDAGKKPKQIPPG